MTSTLKTRVCISGGGPAGIMAGFLMARAGIETIVLEKHVDFFRDFRGDTIHPSTMDVLSELGILKEFLEIPHDQARELKGVVGDQEIILADFSHLKVHCPYIAFLPQWDFLNFIADQAKKYPAFRLMTGCEVTNLIQEGQSITGVKVKTPQGQLEIQSELLIGADGRHSTVRNKSGLQLESQGAPMDVLWFRLSKEKKRSGVHFWAI